MASATMRYCTPAMRHRADGCLSHRRGTTTPALIPTGRALRAAAASRKPTTPRFRRAGALPGGRTVAALPQPTSAPATPDTADGFPYKGVRAPPRPGLPRRILVATVSSYMPILICQRRWESASPSITVEYSGLGIVTVPPCILRRSAWCVLRTPYRTRNVPSLHINPAAA